MNEVASESTVSAPPFIKARGSLRQSKESIDGDYSQLLTFTEKAGGEGVGPDPSKQC